MELKKKLGWIIVAAFIIGFAISWIFLGTRTPGLGGSGTPTSTQASSDGANSVSVSNQAPGLSVSIDSVSLQNPGWVAIHDDRDGKPGNILGAAWLPEGNHGHVSVDLLRSTVSGRWYHAVLHSDNGDKTFDYKVDTAILDASSTPIAVRFSVEAPALE